MQVDVGVGRGLLIHSSVHIRTRSGLLTVLMSSKKAMTCSPRPNLACVASNPLPVKHVVTPISSSQKYVDGLP